MARNYEISLYLYFLQENKRLQQIRRKKGVVLQKKAYCINGSYNEIGEEVRLDEVFVLGSCPLLTSWIFLGLSLVQLGGLTS